jgi:hypothetical protein
MNWRDSWVLFEACADGSGDRITEMLEAEGVKYAYFVLHSYNRPIIRAMGLSEDTSHVFRGSTYIGTEKDVPTAIYTLKRQNGEL